MAKTAGQVTKIYQLKTLGYADISKELDSVAKKFDNIKKSKLSAQGKLSLTQDAVEVKKYSAEIESLILEEQQLRVETQKLTNEQKAAQIQRQAEIDGLRKQKAGATAAAGSYSELYQQYKQLYALVKNTPTGSPVTFQGQTLGFDQAIIKLKQLSAAEQDFRRQFSRDGLLVAEYTSGIVQAFKQLGLGDLIGGQITKAQARIKELNGSFDTLKQELSELKVSGKGNLEAIEVQMIENRKETIALQQQVGLLNREFRGSGDIGNQITSSIGNGFKQLKGQVASFALQYIGLTALISKTQEGIGTAKLASDQTTDLEIQLDGDAKAVDKLNESFSKLNTRTTVTGLQEIADVALKAGATTENIADVTKSIDIVKNAFGKDFGSVEQGTETFAKLINIFFTDGQITGDRILKIGNSVRALANETVASVPYITDFAGRMAGVKQIANVTLPDIIGLGAGFEQFKQSAETSSTVLVKIIPKLASDVDKFAKIAGLSKEQFSSLLNTNPAEALIRVSEALVKSGKNIEEVSESLKDSELGSGRITTIIATLGGKADVFRQRIARAGETMGETGAITDAFNKKNNNLAATLDKLNKKFTDAFASKTFQAILGGIVGLVGLLISHLPVLITLVGLLTVNYLAQNIALIGLRAQVIFYNAAIGLNLIIINALRLANIAYVAVTFVLNGALKVVTATLRLFGVTAATATGPLSVILALFALLGTALLGISKAAAGGISALEKQNQKLKALTDIQRQSSRVYTEQVVAIDSWIKVIKSAATSADTKRAAVEQLIKINSAFGSAIRNNTVDLNALNTAYTKVTAAIKAQADAEAAAQLTSEKKQKVVTLTSLRQDLEIQKARGNKTLELNSKVERELFYDIANKPRIKGDVEVGGVTYDFSEIIASIKNKEDEAKETLLAYTQAQAEVDAKLDAFLKQGLVNATDVEVDIKALKDKITELDKQIDEFKGSKADLQKKVDEREKLQTELDKLLDKHQSKKGPKIPGISREDKDLFKDIDAIRDEQLVHQETLFQLNQKQEERYLKNVYAINAIAIDRKIKLLDGSNASERAKQAQLALDKIKLEKETNDKIFELRSKVFKEQFDTSVKNAQDDADKVKNSQNVDVSPLDKAQAQLDADKKILDAQLLFNSQMDELEKGRNLLSKKNADDRSRDLKLVNDKIGKDENDLLLANIETIKQQGETSVAEMEVLFDQAAVIIQASKTISQAQKDSILRSLENQKQYAILTRQASTFKSLEEEAHKAYEAGLITLAQYEDILNKLKLLQNQIANSPQANGKGFFDNIQFKFSETIIQTLERAGKEFGKKLFPKQDPDTQDEIGGAIGDAISQTYSLAKDVMNDYFDAEQQRIQENLDLQLQRLDVEKEQVESRAQSQEEIDSIEKQYAAKKKEAENKAHADLKKSKKSEAKIALAAELANIAVQASQYPFPASLIIGGVLTALALGRYALRVSEINREKFALGGKPGEVPTRGGKFGGQPHTKGGTNFAFKGKGYNAEVDELAVIRTRNAPKGKFSVTGTQMQIASAINKIGGGVNFNPGAEVQQFASGGYLGNSLQPPVYTPVLNGSSSSTFTNSISNEKFDELIDTTKQLAKEQSDRIDRLEVTLNTDAVTNAQKKRVKQSSIGTL